MIYLTNLNVYFFNYESYRQATTILSKDVFDIVGSGGTTLWLTEAKIPPDFSKISL